MKDEIGEHHCFAFFDYAGSTAPLDNFGQLAFDWHGPCPSSLCVLCSQEVFARAKQLDPNFDPGVTNERIHFLQSYEDPKGRAATNRQAINNIIQHAGDLSDLNEQYRRSNVRVVNTPLNAIANQFGNQVYTQFQTTNAVLKDELSLYFAGGYAPTADQQKIWDKIQSNSATPAQTEAFAKEVVHLGLRRATTFNSQFKKVMGYDDPNMIIPEAKDAAEKLGLGAEVTRFGSGGGYARQPGAVQAQQSGSAAGYVRVQASDGSVHDIPQQNLGAARQRDPGLKVMQ